MDMTSIINGFIDDGRKNIQQINHVMGTLDDPLEDLKTLTFAGMLSYYGQEHINDIYLAFLKTSFVTTDFSIQDLISKMYHLSDGDLKYLSTHAPGTFYDAVAKKRIDTSNYKFKRTIYVSRGEVDEVRLLKSMVYQMNHVINSIHQPLVYYEMVGPCARMGLSFERLSNRYCPDLAFENALNELQVMDIMNEIFTYGYYDIVDDGARRLLEQIFNSYSMNSIGEDPVVEVIRPLYRNPQFNHLLVDRRISGRTNDIVEEFNAKTGQRSYSKFAFFCDRMATCSDSDAMEYAKRLVKRYNDNYSADLREGIE